MGCAAVRGERPIFIISLRTPLCIWMSTLHVYSLFLVEGKQISQSFVAPATGSTTQLSVGCEAFAPLLDSPPLSSHETFLLSLNQKLCSFSFCLPIFVSQEGSRVPSLGHVSAVVRLGPSVAPEQPFLHSFPSLPGT